MDASIWIGIGLIIVAILFMYIPKLPKKAPENYDSNTTKKIKMAPSVQI